MLNLILMRLWRERRLMFIMFAGMVLVTAFLALGPLYVDSVAASEFEFRSAATQDRDFRVDIRNTLPLNNDLVQRAVDAELQDFSQAERQYITTQTWVCAYRDVSPEPRTSSGGGCYRPYVFEQFDELFTVAEGRMPQAQPQNDDIDIEVVITAGMTELDRTYLGQHLSLDGLEDETVTAEVVGIVEPALPQSDRFWDLMTIFNVVNTPIGDNTRPDISFMMRKTAYENVFLEQSNVDPENLVYAWRISVDRDSVSFITLDQFVESTDELFRRLRNTYPEFYFQSFLADMIADFQQSIADAQGPIILLSFIVMILMIYNIMTTAGLILEQQQQEWAMIASRGGSTSQLTRIQFVTMLILGVFAFVLGPPVALLIMYILSVVGPQAAILDLSLLPGIPPVSILLSGIAAVISIVALTLPAIPAARRSLLYLQQGLSRPPVRPAWARFGLDFMLIFLGAAFLLRLYTINTDGGIEALLADPASMIRVLQSQTTNMQDLFNLAGPVLLLTGAAMLWMRLFPLLIRLIGSVFNRSTGLTARLAFWTVERNPGHYSQLVLLLIGTLALGTASISLSATRDMGARLTARLDTGADGRVQVIPEQYDSEFDFSSLPDVEAVLPMFEVAISSGLDTSLIGLDLNQAASFDDYSERLQPLIDAPQPDYGGLMLPEGANEILLDIYAEPPADPELPITTIVGVDIVDKHGVLFQPKMDVDDPQAFGTFQTHRLSLMNVGGEGPWRLEGIRLYSEQDSREFEHRIYMDNLRVITDSGEEIIVNDFEPDTLEDWRWERTSGQTLEGVTLGMNTDLVTQGENSLRVNHKITRLGLSYRTPLLRWRPVLAPSVPVIVSAAFSELYGSRSGLRRPLDVGDRLRTEFEVTEGFSRAYISDASLRPRTISVNYEVVGVIDSFPMFDSGDVYLLADLPALQAQLNRDILMPDYYRPNIFMLDLTQVQPDAELREAINRVPGVLDVRFAQDRFEEIQREPLANALTGMLFAGFWVSLLLSLIDFGFYMIVTIRRRSAAFGTLQAMGWTGQDLLRLLIVEQAAFITPALVIGVLFGLLLAYLILPFLQLIGGLTLIVPPVQVLVLCVVLLVAFSVMLLAASSMLGRARLNSVMRFGE